MLEEGTSGGREFAGSVASGSFDQLPTDVGFESGKLKCERGLSGADSTGGPGDTHLLDDDDEPPDAFDGVLTLERGQKASGAGVGVDRGVECGGVARPTSASERDAELACFVPNPFGGWR